MTIMPFVLIIQLVMSGVVFELKNYSEAISKFTVSKWGMEGVLRISNKIPELYSANAFSHSADEAMFPMMDPDAALLRRAWGIILLSALVYLALSVLVLQLVDKDKRV